ncbi:hypothetical protein DIPPA_06848 [Diplonema papillatum]|nr:hypothetical protein DIPPA_06848 [Diplonema papillatum]KAJ9472573.1 hypothetical protein DIPPA_06848 [Diplonema papillatum]
MPDDVEMASGEEVCVWDALLRDVVDCQQRADGGVKLQDGKVVRHESEGWVQLERALKRLQGGGTEFTIGTPLHTPSTTPRSHADSPMPGFGTPTGATTPSLDRPMGPFGASPHRFAPLDQVLDTLPAVPEKTAVEGLRLLAGLAAHSNRFIREAAFGAAEVLLMKGVLPAEAPAGLAESIGAGLQDNWSQVRYRATQAVARFAATFGVEKFYDLLLPRLCLNRYYVAEGVRNSTQKVWEAVTSGRGRELVREHLPAFVAYYERQAREQNHAVREAACHCMAELIEKVDGVEAFAPSLLSVLDASCDDPSWPVRDVACLAAARVFAKYPHRIDEAMRGKLYERLLYQSEDPIASVRRHAGEALARFAEAGDDCGKRVLAAVDGMLDGIKSQKEDSAARAPEQGREHAARSTDLSNVTTFGVAKRVRDNDVSTHTNQQMFSCGSLAPGPSTARVLNQGCSHGGTVPRTGLDPWYRTDTAIHTLRYLSEHQRTETSSLLPLLARIPDTLHHKLFMRYTEYWTTVWSSLPVVVRSVGKRPVTGVVNEVLPQLFSSLLSENQLLAAAGADCICALRKLYGETVWRAKLSTDQLNLMNHPLLARAP